MYGMHALLRHGTSTPAHYQHVPAHRGFAGNELVDCFAKLGHEFGHDDLPWCHRFLQHGGRLLPCVSAVCQRALGDATLPRFDGRALGGDNDHAGMSAAQMLAPFSPFIAALPSSADPVLPDVSQAAASECLHVRVASYNVLSLTAPPDDSCRAATAGLAFKAARPTILADNLLRYGIHVASIQETRCPAGLVHTGAFFRFCSGPSNGNLGTELWLRRGHCGALGRGHTLRLSPERFVVHHSDPRRIIASTMQGGLKLAFVCLHAPHRACERHAIDSWWTETIVLCRRFTHQALVILAGDMNAAVGDIVSEHVSDHDSEAEDVSGGYLHELLRELHVWLPATFAHVHSGPSWTFQQLRNGRCVRPDYVALPLDWCCADVCTWVEAGIHACQIHPDHFAAVVQLSVRFAPARARSGDSPAPPPRRPRIDEEAMLSDAGKRQVADILDDIPEVPWDVSAHAHASIVVQHLQTRLAAAFPVLKSRQRHPYLTPSTMQLRAAVARLRRACFACNHRIRRHTLLAWESWKSRGGPDFLQRFDVPWIRAARRSSAWQGRSLQITANRLRTACGQDRADYLERLAAEANSPNSQEAFAAVRRILGLKRRKPYTPDVLPSLRERDGTLCASAEAIAHRWRQHFSLLEAGVDSSPGDILSTAMEEGQAPWTLPEHVASMPSSRDLMCALAQAPLRKAAGPDGLPHGIGRAQPSLLAHRLFPLFLKFTARGVEAAGLKGGTLLHIYKNKGPVDQCDSHRGILLLSCIAKCFHKATRPALATHFAGTSLLLQLSGKKGVPVTFGAHLIRTFIRVRAAAGRSCMVLFADIAAAYYSAVRELSTSPVGQSRLDAILDGLHLHPEDEQLLREHISQPPALVQDQAPRWTAGICSIINHGTWMRIAGAGDCPVRTSRGTRPGSCFADLLFGAVLKRVVECRDSKRSSNHRPRFEWDGCRDLTTRPATTEVAMDDVVWADDLAEAIDCSSARECPHTLGVAAGCLSDAFAEHGMRLSYGPKKTAATVLLRGPGSKHVATSLFQQPAQVRVLREHCSPDLLHLVSTYRHVGVQQSFDGSFRCELRHRIAEAWGAFRSARRKIFRNPNIAFGAKQGFLRSLVISKLLYGAGSWPPLRQGEWRSFYSVLLSLYRQILGLRHGDNQHLHASSICARARLPSPEVTLHLERCRYLRQLILVGPDVLVALVKLDEPYRQALLVSLRWLSSRLRTAEPLGDPTADWASWEALFKAPAGRFKGMLKCAARLEQCRLECLDCLSSIH